MSRTNAGLRAMLVGSMLALGLPVPASANMRYHYDCRVDRVERLPGQGNSPHPLELSHFTCHVTGGLLHGFVATGTNILERLDTGGRLVGSMVVAQKGASTLVYEVRDGTRRSTGAASWESTGGGIYKLATGSAAPLAGKSFSSAARSRGDDAFTIDVVVAVDPGDDKAD